MATIRLSLKSGALADLSVAVDGAVADAFDVVEQVMREEGNQASVDIVTEGFGLATGPSTLRIRSGRAAASITAETQRLAPFQVLTRVGALDAPPDVLQYLIVQEEGATLRPKTAQKLAFPPGDAGGPARAEDLTGIQTLTAREFLQDYHALGYAYVRFTDDAILARLEGHDDFQLIFIRRSSVTIPARHPIGAQAVPTLERIESRLREELG